MINNQLKTQWTWFDLSMSSKVKFYKVNWKAIYDFVYVYHTNFDPTMYRFWDISSNRSQRSKLDLSDLENYLSSDSTSFILYDSIGFTIKKLHDAINLSSTLLLMNNIINYGKMDQTAPFLPLKWRQPRWLSGLTRNSIKLAVIARRSISSWATGIESCIQKNKGIDFIGLAWSRHVRYSDIEYLKL